MIAVSIPVLLFTMKMVTKTTTAATTRTAATAPPITEGSTLLFPLLRSGVIVDAVHKERITME